MKNRVVITGMGLIGPCGNNVDQFVDGLQNGNANICELEDSEYTKIKFVGRVAKFNAEEYFPKRLLKKCDRFSKLALMAVQEAITMSGISLEATKRIGIFVGNNTGGWESSHNGLKNLFIEKKPVSPYMASNWFPAAVQGHISLAYGIKGVSKTVIADRVSGIVAMKNAIRYIEAGKIDAAIVGGVEAPIDEWALKFYEETGQMSIDGRYKIASEDQTGLVLSEGAGFLILEKEEYALKRKNLPKILGVVEQPHISFYGGKDTRVDIEEYKRLILMGMGDGIDYVSISGNGNAYDDQVEHFAIQELPQLSQSYITCSKLVYGNTIAASAIFDLILLIDSMNNGYLQYFESSQHNKREYKNHSSQMCGSSAVVLSRGYGGTMGILPVRKYVKL